MDMVREAQEMTGTGAGEAPRLDWKGVSDSGVKTGAWKKVEANANTD